MYHRNERNALSTGPTVGFAHFLPPPAWITFFTSAFLKRLLAPHKPAQRAIYGQNASRGRIDNTIGTNHKDLRPASTQEIGQLLRVQVFVDHNQGENVMADGIRIE